MLLDILKTVKGSEKKLSYGVQVPGPNSISPLLRRLRQRVLHSRILDDTKGHLLSKEPAIVADKYARRRKQNE